MAILDIDTEILRAAVTSAEQTNAAISEALNFLNQVVIHNDWQCQERYKINENTMINRQTAQEIQNRSTAFYQAVKQSSIEFDEVEKVMVSKTNSVDGMISRIVSVVPGMTGAVSGAIMEFPDFEPGSANGRKGE